MCCFPLDVVFTDLIIGFLLSLAHLTHSAGLYDEID